MLPLNCDKSPTLIAKKKSASARIMLKELQAHASAPRGPSSPVSGCGCAKPEQASNMWKLNGVACTILNINSHDNCPPTST